MQLPSKDEQEMYRRWGVQPPSHQEHGLTDDEILEKLVPAEVSKWHLEGNELVAETNLGVVRQRIPTNYIMTGTDKKGLPIFERVVKSK